MQTRRLTEAGAVIRQRCKWNPETLLILGSGLGGIAELLTERISIAYPDIPHFPAKAVEGQAGTLHIGLWGKKPLYIMEGRPHYYQGFSDEEMRFPIHLFASLGVRNLIVTNACGGMNPALDPGSLMVIEDHINLMGRNPLVGDNEESLGPRFVDMSEPYDQRWIQELQKIASEAGISLQKGIYLGYLGPSYETAAEIRLFRDMGADAVGMSTVPEVIVANHAGMKVLGLACITNRATGLSETKLSHTEVLSISKEASAKIATLLTRFLTRL